MKIFIIGSDNEFSIENIYKKYFRNADNDIYHFPAQSIFYEYYYQSLSNKLLYKIGLSSILKKINVEIIEKIKTFNPKYILIFKGMEVFPETIMWMKKEKFTVVNYNPDNPFIFSGKGSGNKNVKNSINLYDAHFTYNRSVQKKIINNYNIDCYWVPFGFEISTDIYQECTKEDEVLKACFVGNPDKDRVTFLKDIADKNVELEIFGNNWNKFLNHKNISINPPVYGADLWKILRKYRVQLNPLRIHNLDSHCMRSFEVPAIGGIMLTPRTSEHCLFFEEESEAFFYNEVDEAVININKILSFDLEKSISIRNAARNRSLNSGYSYQERANFLLTSLSAIEK